MRQLKRFCAIIIALLAGFAGFTSDGLFEIPPQVQAQAPESGPPPAMPVSTITITQEPVQLWSRFSARLSAVEFAQIRPQVRGQITEIRFRDGDYINTGDVMFVIDPRPYEAQRKQADAALQSAKHAVNLAEKELKRAKALRKSNAIAKSEYDERLSARDTALALVLSAEGKLELAELNLDYAYVKAPFNGRASRADIKVGNIVDIGINAPVLTTLVSHKALYADFEMDETSYLNIIHQHMINNKKAGAMPTDLQIPVELSLNNPNITRTGYVDSFDNQLDIQSGTIKARARFANNDGMLLPGMFATLRMANPDQSARIIVPESAIGTDQDRKFVYVIDDKNMTEYRAVTLGAAINGKREITSGLDAGETIVANGLFKLHPGTLVAPAMVENTGM